MAKPYRSRWDDGIDAGALREELERIGAIVELEDGGKPVRAPSRNET